MTQKRFNELVQHTRGYDIREFGVSEEETWSEQRNFLNNLHPPEKEIFASSVKLLLNKKMEYW